MSIVQRCHAIRRIVHLAVAVLLTIAYIVGINALIVYALSGDAQSPAPHLHHTASHAYRDALTQ